MLVKPTKKELREQLEAALGQYVAQGGEVKQIARGISGFDSRYHAFTVQPIEKPAQQRTDLSDVLKTLSLRKAALMKKPVRRKPTKKLIYDDFGEPLRWVTVEE